VTHIVKAGSYNSIQPNRTLCNLVNHCLLMLDSTSTTTREVQYRRTKSLNKAIHIINDYPRIKLGMKYGQSAQASVNFVSSRIYITIATNAARDCWTKNKNNKNNRQKAKRRPAYILSYNETYSYATVHALTMTQTFCNRKTNSWSKSLNNSTEGSASHRLEERRSKREPQRQRNQVVFEERQSSTESSNRWKTKEHDSENEIPQEQPITKAKRKHEDNKHGELSDERPRSRRQTRAS
jgi:hypothetical protein